jgi:type IV secretion system protein VirB4
MMNLAEYRNRNTRLADFLPWAALVGTGVVLNKDGSFQRTARFRGPDLDSAVAAELVAVAGRLNNAFRRLGSGWAIFVEAQRHPPIAIRTAISRRRVGAGRCRAQGRLRGGRRAFRVQLFPDLRLAAAGRGRGARRKLALRGPRTKGVDPHERWAASPTAPTAAAPGRRLHAGVPLAR